MNNAVFTGYKPHTAARTLTARDDRRLHGLKMWRVEIRKTKDGDVPAIVGSQLLSIMDANEIAICRDVALDFEAGELTPPSAEELARWKRDRLLEEIADRFTAEDLRAAADRLDAMPS